MARAMAAFALGLLATCVPAPVEAQNSEDDAYRLVVIFGSVCCGINRPAFNLLSTLVAEQGYFLGRPLEQRYLRWGMEGEINVCLRLTELSGSKQADFVARVRSEVQARVYENIPCKGGPQP